MFKVKKVIIIIKKSSKLALTHKFAYTQNTINICALIQISNDQELNAALERNAKFKSEAQPRV